MSTSLLEVAPQRRLRRALELGLHLLGFAILAAVIPLFGISGMAVVLGAAMVVAALVVARVVPSPTDWLFAAILLMPFALGLVIKTSGHSLFGMWQVPVLLMALLGLPAFTRAVSEDALLRLFVGAFGLFLLWGLASSVLGRTRPLSGAYQFASNLKPLLAVMLGFAIVWTRRVPAVLGLVVRWAWVLVAALVAFEWLTPGFYFAVFPGSGGGRASVDPTGLLPSRAIGPFEHPSFLATSCAFLAIVSAAWALHPPAHDRTRRLRYWLLSVVYLLLIVCAVQRQELASCIVAILLMFVLARRNELSRRIFVSSMFALLAAIAYWSVYSSNILRESEAWGIGHWGRVEHPRAQIFQGAWRVASDNFPFGAGLGTYGGAGAAKFDETLYLDLGFGRYWWFGREDYLLDTYWPNSIGETGFLGASFLFLAYLSLLMYAARRCLARTTLPDARAVWAAAAGGMAYMLLLSATSPAFQDPRLFVWPALLIGIAYGANRRLAV